jgi:tight adherence protein C
MEATGLFFSTLLGISIGLFIWSGQRLVRETVEPAGVDTSAESLVSGRLFRTVFLPFVQIFSYYIQMIPSEEIDEGLGLADESLRTLTMRRRFFRAMGRIRKGFHAKLLEAGKRDVFTPDEMIGSCLTSAILWAGIGFTFVLLQAIELFWLPAFPLLGLIYPIMALNAFVKRRNRKIVKALPYAMDLLSLSMEAGLDFTTALGRIVDRQRGTPLGIEFGEMLRRIKIGETRRDALHELASRIHIEDIISFTNSLIQADDLGTPIGPILRTLSEQMRVKRFQRAEELAGKAPVKILLPLVLFIFPTVFLVLFGPIILEVTHGGG